MKANEFEQRFEAGEDILDALDLSKARRVAQGQNRSMWIFLLGWWSLWTASRVGVNRQSIIKVRLAERLQTLTVDGSRLG